MLTLNRLSFQQCQRLLQRLLDKDWDQPVQEVIWEGEPVLVGHSARMNTIILRTHARYNALPVTTL